MKLLPLLVLLFCHFLSAIPDLDGESSSTLRSVAQIPGFEAWAEPFYEKDPNHPFIKELSQTPHSVLFENLERMISVWGRLSPELQKPLYRAVHRSARQGISLTLLLNHLFSLDLSQKSSQRRFVWGIYSLDYILRIEGIKPDSKIAWIEALTQLRPLALRQGDVLFFKLFSLTHETPSPTIWSEFQNTRKMSGYHTLGQSFLPELTRLEKHERQDVITLLQKSFHDHYRGQFPCAFKEFWNHYNRICQTINPSFKETNPVQFLKVSFETLSHLHILLPHKNEVAHVLNQMHPCLQIVSDPGHISALAKDCVCHYWIDRFQVLSFGDMLDTFLRVFREDIFHRALGNAPPPEALTNEEALRFSFLRSLKQNAFLHEKMGEISEVLSLLPQDLVRELDNPS